VLRWERHALTVPSVFAVSLVWPSPTATGPEVEEVLALLVSRDPLLDLARLFVLRRRGEEGEEGEEGEDAGAPASSQPPHALYALRGVVCFYGAHYVCLMREEGGGGHGHGADAQWILLDDAQVRRVGGWDAVVRLCVASRYQPTLLWFERAEDGGGGTTADA
jgi:hypothetical protein